MRFRFLMWIFSCSQTNNETSNFEIMSITYQYLDGVLCLEGKGNYELTDFDQVLDEGIKSAYRGEKIKLLIDDQQSQFLPSTEEARELVKIIHRQAGFLTGHVAHVVADDAQFGMGRMISVFAEEKDFNQNVFRDRSEAWHWLLTQ